MAFCEPKQVGYNIPNWGCCPFQEFIYKFTELGEYTFARAVMVTSAANERRDVNGNIFEANLCVRNAS